MMLNEIQIMPIQIYTSFLLVCLLAFGRIFTRKKAHMKSEPLEYSVGESNPYCKIENLEY